MPIFRLGELFCGPGGIGWGATHADIGNEEWGIVHQWANDFDESTCRTYRRNICPENSDSVYCEDVHTLNLRKLGFKGKYGPLYTYGVEVLKLYRPMWFLAENVGGLRSANEGKAYDKILSDMKLAGYRVYPDLYKFEEYGIPQARHRIIIIGIRDDLPYEFRIPAPTGVIKTCRQAIEEPPIPPDAYNNELTNQSAQVVRRLNLIGPGQNVWDVDLPDELKIHTRTKISTIYKRLDPEKPSYTVTGSGGGGTHIYHWEEPRALTNRERARLQTFPDDYFFEGSKEQVRKQIGMAVPCEGAKIIFEAVLKTFAGIPYDAVHGYRCR